MTAFEPLDLKKTIANENNGRMRIRLIAMSHINDGLSRTQTAKYLKVSRRSVNKWRISFLSHGIDGLKEKPRSGRPSKLSDAQVEQLKKHVEAESIKPEGGRLMGKDLIDYIKTEFSIDFKLSNIYRLLHQYGFSWITSRSKHPKQSDVIQEKFKKDFWDIVKKHIPGGVLLKDIDVWFQDEARFGQQNTTTRLWAERGTRPRAVQQQQFESAYLL